MARVCGLAAGEGGGEALFEVAATDGLFDEDRGVTVFTELTLTEHRAGDFSRFETRIRKLDEIVECHLVSGGYDYLLKFVTRGVAHYQSVIEGMLEGDYGIEKYFSYVVIKSPFIKHHYPLQHLFDEHR